MKRELLKTANAINRRIKNAEYVLESKRVRVEIPHPTFGLNPMGDTLSDMGATDDEINLLKNTISQMVISFVDTIKARNEKELEELG